MTYNPFSRPVGERLDEENLAELVSQGVAEGYYVEYKRQLPAALKIARSLAAFANTYGGWYIVGVITDAHNVATAVEGFSSEVTHDPVAVVRDSVRHNIDPAPLFFPQVVTLRSGNLACIVYVPGNQATPFVTRDGRIYRRTSDSSEPVPEASRHALDQLVERGKSSDRAFARFAKDTRTFSKSEEQGWAHIYISPEPLGVVFKDNLANHDAVVQLLSSTSESRTILKAGDDITISGNISCNSARPTTSSVILRQVAPQREAFNSLSLEYDELGRARIHIPLDVSPEHSGWNLRGIRSAIARSAVEAKIAPARDETFLKQFDIGRLWLVTAISVSHYLDWLGSEGMAGNFRVALGFSETWRYVPFIDADEWGTYVATLGVPVTTSSAMEIPSDPASRYHLRRDGLWIGICLEQAYAFGLTGEVFSRLLNVALLQAQARSASS